MLLAETMNLKDGTSISGKISKIDLRNHDILFVSDGEDIAKRFNEEEIESIILTDRIGLFERERFVTTDNKITSVVSRSEFPNNLFIDSDGNKVKDGGCSGCSCSGCVRTRSNRTVESPIKFRTYMGYAGGYIRVKNGDEDYTLNPAGMFVSLSVSFVKGRGSFILCDNAFAMTDGIRTIGFGVGFGWNILPDRLYCSAIVSMDKVFAKRFTNLGDPFKNTASATVILGTEKTKGILRGIGIASYVNFYRNAGDNHDGNKCSILSLLYGMAISSSF